MRCVARRSQQRLPAAHVGVHPHEDAAQVGRHQGERVEQRPNDGGDYKGARQPGRRDGARAAMRSLPAGVAQRTEAELVAGLRPRVRSQENGHREAALRLRGVRQRVFRPTARGFEGRASSLACEANSSWRRVAMRLDSGGASRGVDRSATGVNASRERRLRNNTRSNLSAHGSRTHRGGGRRRAPAGRRLRW